MRQGLRRAVAGHDETDIGGDAGSLAPSGPGNRQPGVRQIGRNGLAAVVVAIHRNLDGAGQKRREARHEGLARLVIDDERDLAAAGQAILAQRLDQIDFGRNAVELAGGGNHRLRRIDGDVAIRRRHRLAIEGLGKRQVLVVERHEPAQAVLVGTGLKRNIRLDVARDRPGKVARHDADMAHGIDRLIGGEFRDRRRLARHVDVQRADDRMDLHVVHGQAAVAGRHGAPARQKDRPGRQGDPDIGAVELDGPVGVPHRRDTASRVEARILDLEAAGHLFVRRLILAGFRVLRRLAEADVAVEDPPAEEIVQNPMARAFRGKPGPQLLDLRNRHIVNAESHGQARLLAGRESDDDAAAHFAGRPGAQSDRIGHQLSADRLVRSCHARQERKRRLRRIPRRQGGTVAHKVIAIGRLPVAGIARLGAERSLEIEHRTAAPDLDAVERQLVRAGRERRRNIRVERNDAVVLQVERRVGNRDAG